MLLNTPAKFYSVRGRCGFIHADCIHEFLVNNTHWINDSPRRPEVDSALNDLGNAVGSCLHCGMPLSGIGYPDNVKAAIAVGDNETALRKRLEEARTVLAKSCFGKGTFDFVNKRLVGANGLVLQWRIRHDPNMPISYENQQTNCGIVILTGSNK